MALIKCPECSTEVSEAATKCPKCGVTLRELTRSFFGKFVKWTFIAFNVLMVFWMISGMGAATENIEGMSDAEQAGTAIGAGIGAFLIGTIWAIGDFILGMFVFFTRPSE